MRRQIWRRRRPREEDLEAEIESHLRMAARDRIERGESVDQAASASRREFGNVALVREATRGMWGGSRLAEFGRDLRYGARLLRKSPGFAAVVLVTLALGIGANAAIFSLFDAVLLKMLPVQHPEELVELTKQSARISSFSYPAYEQFRDRNHTLSGIVAVSNTPLHVTGDSNAPNSNGQYVSGNFFQVLGINTAAGRMIVPEDDNSSTVGGAQVAVISFGFWQRRFGRDLSVVGRQIQIEEKPFTIVGVAPPEFFGLQTGRSPDFWIPLAAEPLLRQKSWLHQGDFNWLSIVGRLRAGASVQQAGADLQLIFKQLLDEMAPRIKDEHGREQWLAQKVVVAPAGNGLSELRRQFSRPLMILMVLVGLVLLIACVNISNLLLVRSASRRVEIAVRLALGASRSRLVRQLLTESILLSVLGGAAGLAFARWANSLLLRMMSSGATPLALSVRPNSRVLAFTMAVSFMAAILFGLAPALGAARGGISAALNEAPRGLSAGRPRLLVGRLLVIAQVMMSLVLVLGAGLFTKSLRNLMTVDAGFNWRNVVQASLNPAKAGYRGDRLQSYYGEVLERARRIPGVRSASLSWFTPIAGGGVDLPARVEGYQSRSSEDTTVYVNHVSPGYFATIGTPVLTGRDFADPETHKVAVINEAMMTYYFQGGDPIGKRVTLGNGEPMEIVGVVRNAKYMSLREEAHRTVYVNCMQDAPPAPSLVLAVKSAGGTGEIVSALRRETHALDGNAPVTFSTLAVQVDNSVVQERLIATLSGFFGLLAVLLACVGLSGVMSYNVARRTKELGIRMALGARRGNVIRMVLTETILLAAVGIALGVPIAIVAGRLASSQISGLLFRVSVGDWKLFAGGIALMAGVATLASLLPARRASKVDPMIALRCE